MAQFVLLDGEVANVAVTLLYLQVALHLEEFLLKGHFDMISEAEKAELLLRIQKVKGWRHRMEIAPGVFTPGIHHPAAKLKFLNLPEQMGGMQVLDIGASDGFYSFECERRGAEVTAIDVRESKSFQIAAKALKSKVVYRQGSLYDLDLGKFDLVLCLNVLYHLKDIYGAVERLREFCSGKVIGCTWAIDNGYVLQDGTSISLADFAPAMCNQPIVQLISGVPKYRDLPSYWVVSKFAMQVMLEKSGFVIDEIKLLGKDRVYFWAH